MEPTEGQKATRQKMTDVEVKMAEQRAVIAAANLKIAELEVERAKLLQAYESTL